MRYRGPVIVILLLVAFGGAVLAYYGFRAWEQAGYPWPSRFSTRNDGAFAGFAIGVIVSVVCLFTIVLNLGSSGKDSN